MIIEDDGEIYETVWPIGARDYLNVDAEDLRSAPKLHEGEKRQYSMRMPTIGRPKPRLTLVPKPVRE